MRVSSLLLAVVIGLLAGCSSEPKKVKVSGTVKYKGEPLPGGSISFVPEGPGGSMSGTSVKNGTFELPAELGLLPGKYKVSITRPDPKGAGAGGDAPGASRDAKELLPEKYNAKTELTAEVKAEGPNEFPFDLK